MEGFSPARPGKNPLQSAATSELCFIHEFGAECYEFLRSGCLYERTQLLPTANRAGLITILGNLVLNVRLRQGLQ